MFCQCVFASKVNLSVLEPLYPKNTAWPGEGQGGGLNRSASLDGAAARFG